MNRQITDNIVFRILFPPISGMILYLTMLTIFDSLDQLTDSFFSQEAAFIVILTYLNHELTVLLVRKWKGSLVLHFSIILVSSILVNSALTSAYFIYLLGYMNFRTELLTINILFLLFHIMVNLYYLSIVQISKVRDISLQKEEDLARQIELELESFQNEMNPGLLLTCLETLINLVHLDTKESEKYIHTLSNHYRYILDNRHMEITDLSSEIDAAGELVYLLAYNIKQSMILKTSIDNGTGLQIIPGSLLTIVNWIFNNMIASPLRPIQVNITIDSEQNVLVSHLMRQKLQTKSEPVVGLEKLNNSYRHYSGSEIESREDGQEIIWSIPRIPEIRDN